MSNNEEKKGESLELMDPTVHTVIGILKNTLSKLRGKPAVILWSSYVLLTLWGPVGNSKLLFPDAWRKALFPNLVWRDQLVTFLVGFILLVVIPCLIIKFRFKEKLSDYGLGWPKDTMRLGLLACGVTLAVAIPLFFVGTFNEAIQDEYPLFMKSGNISGIGEFVIYELVYFLFFICIEFIFRGYLLFGLYGVEAIKQKLNQGIKGPLVFGVYAIYIQMLAYTMWHLPKPMPEYIGALFWGVVVAAIAVKIRTIWPIIIIHWILNVFIDVVLWIR